MRCIFQGSSSVPKFSLETFWQLQMIWQDECRSDNLGKFLRFQILVRGRSRALIKIAAENFGHIRCSISGTHSSAWNTTEGSLTGQSNMN